MNASSCTEKGTPYEQRPTADDVFQARSPYLFDNKKQSPHLEIYGQLPVNQEILLKAKSFKKDRKTNSRVNNDTSSVLPPPLGQSSYSDGEVPLCNGKRTWGWQKIGDGRLLKAVAEV